MATALIGALSDASNSIAQVQDLLRAPDLMTSLTDDLVARRSRAVRLVISVRRARDQRLGGDLFVDPAWNMVLDAYASELANRRVSVTDLCVMSGAPNTTALRWLKVLEARRILSRQPDAIDRRRAFVTLTVEAREIVERLIDEVVRAIVPLPAKT